MKKNLALFLASIGLLIGAIIYIFWIEPSGFMVIFIFCFLFSGSVGLFVASITRRGYALISFMVVIFLLLLRAYDSLSLITMGLLFILAIALFKLFQSR